MGNVILFFFGMIIVAIIGLTSSGVMLPVLGAIAAGVAAYLGLGMLLIVVVAVSKPFTK